MWSQKSPLANSCFSDRHRSDTNRGGNKSNLSGFESVDSLMCIRQITVLISSDRFWTNHRNVFVTHGCFNRAITLYSIKKSSQLVCLKFLTQLKFICYVSVAEIKQTSASRARRSGTPPKIQIGPIKPVIYDPPTLSYRDLTSNCSLSSRESIISF